MKFYCIADEDTVRGLRLAGVSGQAVATAQEASAALATAAADPENGIIILTQNVAAGIRAKSKLTGSSACNRSLSRYRDRPVPCRAT